MTANFRPISRRIAITVTALACTISLTALTQVMAEAAKSTTVKKETLTLTRKATREGDRTSATVSFPVLSGSNAATIKAVNSIIGIKAALDNNLEDVKKDFQESAWLTKVDYQITYHSSKAISVLYQVEGIGPYPDEYSREANADLQTGQAVRFDTIVKDKKAIQSHLNGLLHKAIRDAAKPLTGESAVAFKEYFNEQSPAFSKGQLEHFVMTNKGLRFRYDYDMPHVLKAIEPPGVFEITWDTARPWLKKEWVQPGK